MMKASRNPLANYRLFVALGMILLLVSISASAQQAANTISTVAGGGTPPTDPLQADLPGPLSAVEDAQGNIYIAAPFSRYIFELSGGALSIFSGQGYGGYKGDGGKPSDVTLGGISSFAFDSKGNMYIGDFVDTRIWQVSNNVMKTVIGNGTKCDLSTKTCGDGGPATAAFLNIISAIAVDGAGNVYIADTNDNRIRAVNMGTTTVSIAGVSIAPKNIATIAGDGNTCSSPITACGDGGPAISAQLSFPQGVAVDGSGNIYISDTKDQRIRVILAGSSNITAFAGNGGSCPISTGLCGDGNLATAAHLHLPSALAVDASGNVYIADSSDHRIRAVNPGKTAVTLFGVAIQPGNIATVAGNGTQGYTGDGKLAKNAELDLPAGVYVDQAGNMLVSDTGNQVIREVSPSSNFISRIAGGGMGGDGGPAKSALFAEPYSVAEDSAGNVFLADQDNNRIRKLTKNGDPTTFTVSTVAGTGSAGFSGDSGSATSATLNQPGSIAMDLAGDIFIADSNNARIRKVDTSSVITTVAGDGGPCFPTTNACGDGGPATQASFAFPIAVALDSANNIYISDYFGYRIRAVNTQSTATTIAGITIQPGNIATIAGTGVQGRSGDGGKATKALLNHPVGLAVDNAGNVYISDQWNNEIRQVNSSGIINHYALNGHGSLSGNGGLAINGSMWNPLMLTLDSSANLYISGGNDDVVQRIDAITGEYGTVAGNPTKGDQGGYSGDGGPATQAKMANVGSSVDAQLNLYIADGGNNRIRYVPLAPAVTVPTQPVSFGVWPLGQSSNPMSVTLTSSGGADVNLTSIGITGTNAGDFTQTNNCNLPALLGPYATCKGNVTFTPSGYSKRTATLNFTDNVGTQSVALTGSGPDFTISASPTQLTIQPGMSGSSTVTLTPLGQFNQAISMACVGAPAQSTCTFSQNSVQMDGINPKTTILALTTQSQIAPGTYTITAWGSFPPARHPASITVTIP